MRSVAAVQQRIDALEAEVSSDVTGNTEFLLAAMRRFAGRDAAWCAAALEQRQARLASFYAHPDRAGLIARSARHVGEVLRELEWEIAALRWLLGEQD